MLRHAVDGAEKTGVRVPLVQADALALPFPDRAFDIACTAFGAIPFVDDSAAVMREVFRVLRPGGRWVFSVTHPMRWIFLDDPGEGGLCAVHSYFDREPYVEQDEDGVATYVEQHRTLGDRIRELVAAGFVLRDLVEPEWPAGHEQIWGQWCPLRGRLRPPIGFSSGRRSGADQSGDGVGGLTDLFVGLGAAGLGGLNHAVAEVLVEQAEGDRLQRLGHR
jgi:SAM-dependent methyltransferase